MLVWRGLIAGWCVCICMHTCVCMCPRNEKETTFVSWDRWRLYVSVYMYVFMCMHVWACESGGYRLNEGMHLLHLLSLVWYRVSHWTWSSPVWLGCLASEAQGCFCLPHTPNTHPALGLWADSVTPRFFKDPGHWPLVFLFTWQWCCQLSSYPALEAGS